jgi:hypothetical protein
LSVLPQDSNQAALFETTELCKIPDEIMGLTLQAYLLEAGIDSNLRDMRASFYGSVLENMQGYWGTIIVAKQDEKRAREVYADFKKQFETG